MAALKAQVVADTLAEVQIVYLDRATTKWWNARRRPADTAAFTGWFWIRGAEEAGPFKTRSAAIRAAYYMHVLSREVPHVGHAAIKAPAKRAARRGRPPKLDGTGARA